MDALFLAQSAETAEQGIGILNAILSGGVPLICLVAACIMGWAYWKQLKRNNALEVEFRTKIETSAGTELTRQETLLREMLSRDKEATETTSAAIQAIESYSHSLKEQQISFEAMKVACETAAREQAREIRELRDKVGSLEDTVRRLRDA